MRIAVIGAGVAGLGAAWLLGRAHDVVVYEREARLGGHSHTVDAPGIDGPVPVDTGFIVYNEANYPNLVALFERLGVATEWSDMSFAVSLDGGRFEYGSGWRSFLGQRRNLLRPAFHGLALDIVRFNREAPALLRRAEDLSLTLRDYLAERGFGQVFAERYLLPMAACIWSAPLGRMLDFPAQTFVRFFANHGLLTVADQPRWRTVSGGSRAYVARLAAEIGARARTALPAVAVRRRDAKVEVRDARGQRDVFDRVVLATHGDEALALLDDADARERAVLGAFAYERNEVVLHADPALMPRRRRVWSSWNYVARSRDFDGGVSLTYWMNRLQNLDPRRDLFVSVNPGATPAAALTFGRFAYDHPVFDRGAIEAQRELPAIQGARGVYFCGSWCGYGFHEDALASGLDVAEQLGVRRPWSVPRGRLRVGDPPRIVPALPGLEEALGAPAAARAVPAGIGPG